MEVMLLWSDIETDIDVLGKMKDFVLFDKNTTIWSTLACCAEQKIDAKVRLNLCLFSKVFINPNL